MSVCPGIRCSILTTNQLSDKTIDEAVQWRSTDWPNDEFRQASVQVGIELAVQLVPAGSNQLARIKIWTTPAYRRGHLRRQLTVEDGQRNAEVIGLYLPPCLCRGPFDRRAPFPRFGRGKKTTQPAVGHRADATKRRGRRAAHPN